jgi:hypothetical protein
MGKFRICNSHLILLGGLNEGGRDDQLMFLQIFGLKDLTGLKWARIGSNGPFLCRILYLINVVEIFHLYDLSRSNFQSF